MYTYISFEKCFTRVFTSRAARVLLGLRVRIAQHGRRRQTEEHGKREVI